MHNDLLTARMPLKDKIKTVYGYSGSVCVVLAVWTTRLRLPDRTVLRLVAPVKTLKCDCRYRFALEDLGFVARCGNGILHTMPLAYAGLTWNFDNDLAGGAYGQGDLTALGAQTIADMNKNGIAVDTAHLNERSFWRVLDAAERPFDSHCACRSLNGHCRNLTDAQLKALAAQGGIVGITAAKELGVPTFNSFVANVDHAVSVAGIDAVAIGTDLFGATMAEHLTTYSHFYFVENALYKRGYSKDDIDKLFCRNAARFFGAYRQCKQGRDVL